MAPRRRLIPGVRPTPRVHDTGTCHAVCSLDVSDVDAITGLQAEIVNQMDLETGDCAKRSWPGAILGAIRKPAKPHLFRIQLLRRRPSDNLVLHLREGLMVVRKRNFSNTICLRTKWIQWETRVGNCPPPPGQPIDLFCP